MTQTSLGSSLSLCGEEGLCFSHSFCLCNTGLLDLFLKKIS